MSDSTSGKQSEATAAASRSKPSRGHERRSGGPRTTAGETAQLDRLLAEISSNTIIHSPDEVNRDINDLLERLLTVLSLDRAFLALYSGVTETLRLSAIKTSREIKGAPTGFVSKPLPWYSNRLLQGKITRFSRVEDLPVEEEEIENLMTKTVEESLVKEQ